MKRTIIFIDKDKNKVTVDCEITTRNGYPEFSMCGEHTNSMGQCLDSITPATDEQKQLIVTWKKWHLNNKDNPLLPTFEDDLNELLDTIETHEEEQRDRKVTNEDENLFEDFYLREIAHALALMLNLCVNEIEDIEHEEDYHWTVQGVDYTVGADDEMDIVWDEYLENYIEECILPDLPETAKMYFDNKAWKSDARVDGRGHSLNRYDGGELSISLGGEDYYAYRN